MSKENSLRFNSTQQFPKPPGEKHMDYSICDVLDELHKLRQEIKPDQVSPFIWKTPDQESNDQMDIQLPQPEEESQSEFDSKSINMPSCDECGAYYATLPDLQRHKATTCPNSNSKKGKAKTDMSFEEERPLWLQTVKEAMNKELLEEYKTRIREMVEKEGKSEKKA